MLSPQQMSSKSWQLLCLESRPNRCFGPHSADQVVSGYPDWLDQVLHQLLDCMDVVELDGLPRLTCCPVTEEYVVQATAAECRMACKHDALHLYCYNAATDLSVSAVCRASASDLPLPLIIKTTML